MATAATARPEPRPEPRPGRPQHRAERRAHTSAARPGYVLKPGQRNPSRRETDEAIEAHCRRHRGAGFPESGRYEITRERAAYWREHRFAGLRGVSDLFRRQRDPLECELALLLWDLDLYEDLRRRGLLPSDYPLHAFLQPGREEWGWLGAQARELRHRILKGGLGAVLEQAAAALEVPVTPADLPGLPAATEADIRRERDQALYELRLEDWTHAELAALDVGDVDLEEERIRVPVASGQCLVAREGALQAGPDQSRSDTTTSHQPLTTNHYREIGGAAGYALDRYLDYRPDLDPEQPLFLSREGNRMSERQLRRAAP